MKYSSILIGFMILLTGCAKEPLNTHKTNNNNFEISFLFEYEGIKVYRFFDDGRYHWFTSKDTCINTQKSVRCVGKMTQIKYWDDPI